MTLNLSIYCFHLKINVKQIERMMIDRRIDQSAAPHWKSCDWHVSILNDRLNMDGSNNPQ